MVLLTLNKLSNILDDPNMAIYNRSIKNSFERVDNDYLEHACLTNCQSQLWFGKAIDQASI